MNQTKQTKYTTVKLKVMNGELDTSVGQSEQTAFSGRGLKTDTLGSGKCSEQEQDKQYMTNVVLQLMKSVSL